MPATLSRGLSRLRRAGNPVTIEAAPRWSPSWNVGATGEPFNSERALGLPAVSAAVNRIADQIAAFPLHIFQQSERGVAEKVEDEEFAFLWRDPQPVLAGIGTGVAPFTFWRLVFTHKVVRENVYLFVVKSNGGNPVSLWPINPLRVRVGRLADGRKIYEVDGEFAYFDYLDGGDIVHVVGRNEGENLTGIGPLERHAHSFALSIAAEEYASRMFSQNSTPGGVLETNQDLTQERAEELKARWEASHTGADNWRRVAVLTNDLKWKATAFNPEESQMIESRRFSIADVSRIFLVPPHMLGDVEKSTSWGAGIEEQGQDWLTSLQGHTQAVEGALKKAFLPNDRWPLFNADAVLRARTLERYQAHEIAIRASLKTPNEIRGDENLPPIEGGDELRPPPNASIGEIAGREANPPESIKTEDLMNRVLALESRPRAIVKSIERDEDGKIVSLVEREVK